MSFKIEIDTSDHIAAILRGIAERIDRGKLDGKPTYPIGMVVDPDGNNVGVWGWES